MYSQKELKSMLFIDIETVSEFSNYDSFKKAKPSIEKYWSKKAEQHRATESQLQPLSDSELYDRMSALSPEFGKIIVISIGQIKFDESGEFSTSKIKSFYGDNEAEILKEFMGTAQSIFNANPGIQFIGHNIKNFDLTGTVIGPVVYVQFFTIGSSGNTVWPYISIPSCHCRYSHK